LRHEDEESEEDGPGQEPPVLRGEADGGVNEFDNDGGEDEAEEERFGFIPEPGAKLLGGELSGTNDWALVRLDRPVPAYFEMMFLVRLWPGGIDEEGSEAKLLCWRP